MKKPLHSCTKYDLRNSTKGTENTTQDALRAIEYQKMDDFYDVNVALFRLS